MKTLAILLLSILPFICSSAPYQPNRYDTNTDSAAVALVAAQASAAAQAATNNYAPIVTTIAIAQAQAAVSNLQSIGTWTGSINVSNGPVTVLSTIAMSVNTNMIIGSGFNWSNNSSTKTYTFNDLFTNTSPGTSTGPYKGSINALNRLGYNATLGYYGSNLSPGLLTNPNSPLTTPWTLVTQWMNHGSNVPGGFSYVTNYPIPSTTFSSTSSYTYSLMMPDGTITNLSEEPFIMPWPMQAALANYQNTNTAYVDTNGNDSTGVLGGNQYPFLTVSAAETALPASGGTIWLTPNQNFGLKENVISITKPTVIVAIGDSYNVGGGWNYLTSDGQLITVGSALTILGGSWDYYIAGGANPTTVSYATFFPDFYVTQPIDWFYPPGSGTSLQYLYVDHCKIFNCYDILNQGNVAMLAGSQIKISDSWLIATRPIWGGMQQRDCVFVGPGTAYLKNDILIASEAYNGLNALGVIGQTNICVSASGGAQVTIDNSPLISGTPYALTWGWQASATGSGTVIFYKNMGPLITTNTDGVGQIIGPLTDSPLSPFDTATNFPTAGVTNALLYNGTNSWWSNDKGLF